MLASSSVPPVPRYLGAVLVGGLAAALVVLPVAAVMMRDRAMSADPCAIAMSTSDLTARDRGFIARRMLACSDVQHGRISQAEYRLQVAAISSEWTFGQRPTFTPIPPATQWAATVDGFSSQYSTSSWAATKVLGAPDVFPAHGDNANAWASLGADDKPEWIEVGFAQPTQVNAVEIYETYNPGAITSIELVTADGERIQAYQGSAGATGQISNKLRAEVGCTAASIVAVRVHVASTIVPGWNELDAIGVVPCTEQ